MEPKICPSMVAPLSLAAARSRSSSDSQTCFSVPPSYAFCRSRNSSKREARCPAFPANYFHARQIVQQPPTSSCPHQGHIERVPGPRSCWRARRRGSMLLFFLLLHNVVPGGNWRAPFPGSANDFPDEHRSEGEVRPFLGRFRQLPSFLEVHPGLCLLAAGLLHALRR